MKCLCLVSEYLNELKWCGDSVGVGDVGGGGNCVFVVGAGR